MKKYKHFGVMLDCSRNAVMKVDQVKKFIDCMVKMGYDTLELYAEDTYLLEDEPYFGYLRGGYTGAEIQEIDAYALQKGVELIPCVQTLAHFTNLVKLPPYGKMVDTADILLIDDENTYALIEKIFANAAKHFTSRLINIGMDEAHMVGLGKYLDKHGYQNRFELLNRHLTKVAQIAQKYGFTPHMWSDMFFRLASKGAYYVKDLHIPREVVEKIPENVELVYWDYYNKDKALIESMLTSHVETGRKSWFGGGAWCWNGFAPLNAHSLATMRPAMECVANSAVEDVFITMWGDNGKECSFYATLPALYAIRRYADGEFDEKKIAAEFEGIFGVSFDDFMLLDLPNATKKMKAGEALENPCKSLLYNDCFLGMLDYAMEQEGKIDFADYAERLQEAGKRVGEYGYIFETLSALCEVLEIKADLGIRTRKAYAKKDKQALKALSEEYAVCLARLENFYAKFKALWHKENKGFGFEVHDARLGGVMLRLKSCKERLLAYVNGEIEGIEELEAEILPCFNTLQNNQYQHTVSTSCI